MKLVSYYHPQKRAIRGGWLHAGQVYDLEQTYCHLCEMRGEEVAPPVTLLDFLCLKENHKRWLYDFAVQGPVPMLKSISLDQTTLRAPVQQPPGFRDFYAFEEHVKTARSNRGLGMIPQWYNFPVFYFSNTQALKGHLEPVEKPAYTNQLDYELEIGCVIGKEGRDIARRHALDYIEGFFIINDWSARDVQREEVKVGLGPAKAKDFATSMGPYLVTRDELEAVRKGEHYELEMKARINGKQLSLGNLNTIYYSFAQLIERASDSCTLYPGDVIGSGTVGSGCILELGEETHAWLQKGDFVELEVDKLGVLAARIV
ncbi:fumarylacetoacetate hydrolase family protein [Aneurinibacillus sp. Ricciae_BoGa-3]|uniref:fumarylacetoacetate hydrolase family protein n=1 Tax=Aneurinibacillus sp. Ricciae_BoGa-3 TaxID=3022697 RepID=UPI00234146E4|nr:fumarylacetoacetate hydrolase family protein [Aneurinibacillus sp. Ricciae_BoGa-3]WCK54698.1 fumarylacetoacetate hydrolase family protein [Aneurinibacillus sp. Ricciae_BoGa-3]